MRVLGEGGEKDFGSFSALKEDFGLTLFPSPWRSWWEWRRQLGPLVHASSPGFHLPSVFCLASTPPLTVLDSTALGPLKGTNGHL